MDIIITLVIGGVIGWVASIIMRSNNQMGLIANIVVGIAGSFLGFWLAPKIGIAPSEGVVRWLVAIGGAALLILILRLIGIFK